MLLLVTFLAVLLLIYNSLSPRAKGKVLRFMGPAIMITLAWVFCAVIGLIVNSLYRADDAARVLSWAYTLGLSQAVSSVMDKSNNALAIFALAGAQIITLPLDIVFGTMKLAFSLKFLFLTFMMAVWMVFTTFVGEHIVKPQAEQAKRDEANGVFEGESFHDQVWRLAAEKDRADAAKAEREAAFRAAQAAKAAAEEEASRPKPTPVVYDKYPRPGTYKLPK